jgi:ABC-type transport system involved in cytochrome c biogenesis permease subunit
VYGSPLTLTLIVIAAILYAASAAMATRALFRGERAPGTPGRRIGARVTLVAGAVLLTAALAIATWIDDQLPVYDMAGATLTLIWASSCVYLTFDRAAPVRGLGPVLFPIVLLLFVAAGLLALGGSGDVVPVSNAVIACHVLAAIAAYAAFLVAFGAGILYLVQDRNVRAGGGLALGDQLPSLARLDRIVYGALAAGLPLLTMALLVGLHQAHARGATDIWRDPTVSTAIMLWLFYATVLTLRGTARIRGRKVAWCTIVGFVAVLGTFLGTSLLGADNHPTRNTEVRPGGPGS